ncbi:MAG: NUDIX domain-containing protein [Succinivibrio sp.]|nr:NUDIX domain-containing protein [Succinivibrio sp.]
MTNPAGELVDIVDADNRIVTTMERAQMRRQRLPHRCSYIVCQDAASRFLIEVRTLCKDYAPGLLDACVGGVMQHGEDAVLSAQRELYEELGLKVPEQVSAFVPLGVYKHIWADGQHFHFGYLYYARTRAVTVRQRSEVSGLLCLTEQEVLSLSNCCVGDSLVCFKEILARARAQGLSV